MRVQCWLWPDATWVFLEFLEARGREADARSIGSYRARSAGWRTLGTHHYDPDCPVRCHHHYGA